MRISFSQSRWFPPAADRAAIPSCRIDEQRLEVPGQAVGTCFAGLLVEPVVCVGRQAAALPGLEVHDVVPIVQPPLP